MSYFQQVNEINFPAAWEKATAPVLVFYGESDWVMSRLDHELIAEIVNAGKAGNATLVVYPKTDHHFLVYKTPGDAFIESGGEWDQNISKRMTDWLTLQLSN